MVHHDMKLENAVVTDEGHTKLIDFGALTLFTKPFQAGISCTPIYTPPEVRCPGTPLFDVTAPSYAFDVYSAGGMLWELLCGERVNMVPQSRMCPDGSMGIGSARDFDVIRGLMQRDPHHRLKPQRAIELLSDGPVPAPAVTPPEPTVAPTGSPLGQGEVLCDKFGSVDFQNVNGKMHMVVTAELPKGCNIYPRLLSPYAVCNDGAPVWGLVRVSTKYNVENEVLWPMPREEANCLLYISSKLQTPPKKVHISA